MELFYAYEVSGGRCYLDAEESGHCVRVLRHRAGDALDVIDGLGTLYRCTLEDPSPKAAVARIEKAEPGWGARPCRLTIGCCPTKNNERFEWMVEKATEVGVECIAPLIGDRSERKVYKPERARRIALSATKQSLKARIPEVPEPQRVKDFIQAGPEGALKLIAYCFEDPSAPRVSIQEELEAYEGADVIVLIGPEGDFSPEEVRLALAAGYKPVHLGPSRLRTETAALTAAMAVYFRYFFLHLSFGKQ